MELATLPLVISMAMSYIRTLVPFAAATLLAGSAHAQSAAPTCRTGDEQAAVLRSKIVEYLSTPGESYDRLRTSLGVTFRPADSVFVVSDSLTCSRAVAALDSAMTTHLPGFVPAPAVNRVVYVVRVGTGQHAVWDTDSRLVHGSYGTLWWFENELTSFRTASTY